MGERWNWECGVEGEIPDGPESMTLAEHKAMWRRYSHYWKAEIYRMRHCYGCIYLRTAGNCLCCSHLLVTDKRRPPHNEDGSCGGRVEFPGFAPDQTYRRTLKAAAEYDKATANNADWNPNRRKLPIKWDATYAYGLYLRDFSLVEISKIMGVKYCTVNSYARYHGWLNPAHKVRATHTQDEIKAEIKAWEAYRDKGEDRQTG